jgi:hypothetical protein
MTSSKKFPPKLRAAFEDVVRKHLAEALGK